MKGDSVSANFYIQSEYSLLKSTIPLEKLVDQAKANGYPFLALSDDQLYGLYRFVKYTKKAGIQAIIGLKVDVIDQLNETSFLVYVKTQIGYKNLLSIARLKSEGPITYDTLVKHQEGLIIVTTGEEALLSTYFLNDNDVAAKQLIEKYQADFKHFYLGLCLDTIDLEVKVAPRLTVLANELHVKLLPVHKTAYLNDEDVDAYQALLQIAHKDQKITESANYKMLNQAQLHAMFIDYPFVFDQAEKMVQSITFEWQTPTFDMPSYDTQGASSQAYLKALAIKGLQKRLKNKDVNQIEYQQRLLYELSVIHKMGYDHYFLIVFDFVRYAKQHDIFVGPGRGSAAGSLVSYCLGITDIDPLQYDLLFERFLNPERITMPDIDLDFPDNKRDEVIRYVQQKYGKNHMISIVTFSKFALKSSIRDIARVMSIDHGRVTGIIKRIEQHKIDESDHEMMRLQKVAKQIEGLPRQTGTHAAGMILAKQDLTNHLPLQIDGNMYYQSQWEASDLEQLGLLKIDFLGIRNLTIIHDVVMDIQKDHPSFSMTNIPLNDSKVYAEISEGQTFGIFQLESIGMRQALRKLKPRTFEDIVAILALYRPGPMENIDTYIDRRNGKPFEYIHPDLKPILSSTFGIIVYQEQIMKIAHEFAGYTLAEADILRRGVSKKKHHILEQERIRFIKKCLQKGYEKATAEQIYDYIVKFADYGFNRSHSVAYSLVAYQMAYLKTNYYPYFMTILMSNVIGNSQTTFDYIQDVKRHQISILPPDINESTHRYQLTKKGIRMPLTQIKNLGQVLVKKILEVRKDGLFKNYQDFKLRLQSVLNQKNIQMLIDAGALDCFGLNHQTLYEHHDVAYANYELYMDDFKMKAYEEFPFSTLVEKEKAALGFNLSYHPLMSYQSDIKRLKLNVLKDINKKSIIKALGFVSKIKEIKTKNDKKMAFVTISDGETTIEATMFSQPYEKYLGLLQDQNIKIFTVKQNVYRDKKSYVLERVHPLEQKKVSS